MPTYKLTDPETGKTVRITGDSPPTEQEAEAIFGSASRETSAPEAQPAKPLPNTAMDMARSIPGGLAKGAASVAGFPGDVERGLAWATGTGDKGRFSLPSSGDLSEAIAKPFGGYYEPQTRAGKYAETIASFAPSAASPGSIAARVARVAVPGAASEAAGQATEGTAAEPYARVIGALGGGLAAGGIGGAVRERATSKAIPSGPQLKSASQASYGRAEQSGAVIKGQSFNAAVDRITADMASEGFSARIPVEAQRRLFPKASAALETLQAAKGQNISLMDLDKLRRTARIALESPDKSDRRVAHMIIDGIDEFVNRLSAKSIVSGSSPKQAVASLNEARDLWRKASKSDDLERAMEKAKSTASGFENGLRIEFRKLANNERAMRKFTPAERAAIKTVERGTLSANILKELGKFSPVRNQLTRLLEMGAALGAHAVAGPVGVASAAGVAVGGELARQGSIAATSRHARIAGEAVRSGTDVKRQIGKGATRQGVTSGALGRRELEDDNYAARIMRASELGRLR